jgi:adenylylsulfate kinase
MTGSTVWLTGLPSAGKTTIGQALAARLRAEGVAVEVLDGDDVRARLGGGLGFSKDDRNENVRRIGWLAHLLARNGVTVLVPVIAPYRSARAEVRRRHEESSVPFVEVFVDAPLTVCAARDVKGLYARQARGELTGLTGVDDPYETPIAPEVSVDTSALSIAQCVAQVRDLLSGRGLI